MRDLSRRPELLSINTATVRAQWTLPQIIEGCVKQESAPSRRGAIRWRNAG